MTMSGMKVVGWRELCAVDDVGSFADPLTTSLLRHTFVTCSDRRHASRLADTPTMEFVPGQMVEEIFVDDTSLKITRPQRTTDRIEAAAAGGSMPTSCKRHE